MKKITSHSFRLLLSGLFLMLMFTSSFVYSQHLTISTSGGDVGPIGGTNWGISDNVLYVGNSGSASINISVITNHLANTGDLTINLPGQSNVGRNIYINNTIAYLGSSARTLTFQSGNDIVFANAVGITSATASLNVVLRSATTTGTPDNGSVKMDGINIDTKGGHLWVGGGATTTTWNGLNVGNSIARTYLDDVAGISLVGSTIASGGGKIYMFAQSWNTGDDDGVNYGINVENSNVSSGTGSINFSGGVYGRYNNGIGMRVIGTSATSITSTTGAITIYGYGTDATTNGNLWRTATMISGSVSIKSGSGNIAVTGQAAFASPVNDKEGLIIADGSVICSQTGNITLNGTNTLESSGQYTNSIRFAAGNLANSIRIGYDGTNAYSGNITIEGNSIYQRSTHAGAGSIAVQTTGTLTIQPTGTAFTYMRAGDAGTLTFDNDWNFGTTLGGFVYGKSTNTTALTYSNALTTNSPITMYAGALTQNGAVSSGGAITFNCSDFALGDGINLSTSTASDITINANGYFDTSGSTRRTISSANGNIIIHADKDANGSGMISIDYLTFNPGSGATIIRGETVSFLTGSFSGPYINGTGSFTFQSSDASFGSGIYTSWFEIDQDNNGIGGLTLGKIGNTTDILQNTSLTVAGPVNMYGNSIAISAALTATNSDVSLYANTAVTQTSPIIAAGLSLNGTGTFTLTNTSNNFTTLAGGAVGSLLGTTQIVDVSGGLTIGTIGSNTGLKGANTIRVETLAGNLTLAGNISTTSTSTDAVILTAAKSTAIGVPTGGDILVSGSPTITMGTGAIAKLFSGYDVTSTGLTTLAGGASNVRINYDETTTTYNPVLSTNNKYAIYRTALGYGDLNIVSSGGDAEGSTWTYANGVITPTSGTANVLNTVVQTKLNAANLSIEANKITFSANVTGSTSNTFNLLAKTHIVNTNATTITTQGGNVLLASNVDDATDNENTVNGYIVLGSGLTMNTNGGNITFGGGNTTGTDYALGTSAYPYEGIRVDNIINLNSGGGNISMRGKSYAISTTAGAWGVGFWNLATGSINSGTGTVTLNGFSQSSGSSYSSALFSNGALTITSANTTADAIQMIGKSTGNGGEAWGLEAESALSLLATGTGGGITVSSSQQDSANNYDIVIRGEANILAKSGPINLLGGQSGGIANGTILLGSNSYFGSKASSTVPASSSNITFQYDWTNFSNIPAKLATSGTFNWKPVSASFGQNVATSWFDWNQNNQTLSGLTIGKSGNAANVYLNNTITVAGPISVYGNYVEVSSIITSSATGDILLKGIVNSGTCVNISGGITKSSGTGTLTMQGHGRVQNTGTITTSGTGVLNVIFWSDYNGDNVGGGSTLGGGSISTNGGHVWMGGSNSNGGSYTWNGLAVGDGPSTGAASANCHAIDLFGPITTGGGDVLLWASNNGGCGISGIQSDVTRHINAGSGDITLIAYQTGGGIDLTSTGVISLVPHAGSYASALTLGGTLTSGNFSFNTSHYNGMKINSIANVGGLTVGKYEGMLSSGTPVVLGNTSNVSFTTNTNIGGPIIVYGGTIALDANLTTTNNGDITLYTDNAIAGLSAQRNITAAGSFNYIPRSDSFSAPVTYPITNLNLISSGLLIGKPTNTANITFANTTSIAGPITAYGGDIAVNSNLSSTLSTGTGISLNGTKITQNTNINVVTSGGHIDYVVTNAPFTAGTDDGIGIGQNALVDAAGGNISLTASYASTGVAGTNNLLYDNLIRFSQDSRIVTNGSGTINIIGDGTNNTATGNAVWTISLLANNCRIQTDSGAITIDGTGGKSSTNSRGIVSDGYSARILSTSGPITLIDRKPVGYTGVTYAGLYLRPTSTTNFIIGADGTNVVNSSSPITIQSDRFYVDVTSTRRIEFKTSGSFVLEPLSSSFESFNLTGFTLTGNPSSVRIGKSTNTADITTTSAITAAGPISAYGGNIAVNGALTATNSSISLQASGTVTQSAAITATNLELSGTGTFTLTNTSNNVGTIAGGTSSSKLGSLTYIDSNALTIGAITNPGIIATGKINIQTLTNNLNLNSSVATDNTATDAVILNAGNSAAIGTSTGGDIIVSGTPTVATGTNGIARLYSGSNASSTGLTTLVGGSGNTRNNYDETSTSFSPVLVNGNNYALYRFRDQTCEEILAITVQPSVVTSEVCKDAASVTISFTSTASDYTIQWYSNSSNSYSGATLISGASSNSLSLPTTVVGINYYFARLTSNSVSCNVNTNIVSQRVSPILSYISSISGTYNLASNATTATYSVLPVSGATSYVWSLPSGLTLTGQTGPSITVAVSSTFTSGGLSVYAMNSCGQTSVRNITVRKETPPIGGVAFSVTGTPILCSNATGTYTATTVTGGTYVWEVPNGITITSGQGSNAINVSSNGSFTSGSIRVTCVTTQFTYQSSFAISGVAAPSAISGPSNLCSLSSATYSVTAEPGSSYFWNLPSGMTITSGAGSASIQVSIVGSIGGFITLQMQNSCGISALRYFAVNTSPTVGRIMGVNRVCGAAEIISDTNGNILDNNALNTYAYSVAAVAGAESYIWTVPSGATIQGSTNTNSITVSYDLVNFQSGNITVRAVNSLCGLGSQTSLMVSTVTGAISGPTALCSLTTANYSVPSDLGTGFSWVLPQGMSITSGTGTSNITVAITHPVNFVASNQVSVQFNTACGGSKTLTLGINCSDYTTLSSSQCGATVNYDDKVVPLGVTGATGYAFDIYDASGINLITTIENSYPSFSFVQMNFTFGATYQVKVRVKRGNVYSAAGAACSVTLGNIPSTTISPLLCGTTINPTYRVSPIGVTGVTGYAFDIYDASGVNLITTIENSYQGFSFSQMNFTYGNTYQVKVRVKRGNAYGTAGAACSVTLSNIPTTAISTLLCGTTINPSFRVSPIGVTGATGYAFDVYDASGINLLNTIENSYHGFSFVQMNFTYGATYQVKVRVKRGNAYGAGGAGCSVTLENIPTTAIASSQCGSVLDNVDDKIYANSINGATMYKFQVYDDSDQTNLLAEIEKSVNFFRLTDFNYVDRTTYYVKVSIKHVSGGADYGTAGALCSISTPDVTYTRQALKEKVETIARMEIQAVPNPFTDSFTITSISDYSNPIAYRIFDLSGKLIEMKEIAPEVLSVQQIGTNYPTGVYFVIVTQGPQSKTFRMIKQ